LVDKRLYRVEEIAEMTGMSRAFVYAAIAAGQLKATKLGRATRIDPRDLEDFIEAKRRESHAIAV
jgi:excisionase family DNA binding protein